MAAAGASPAGPLASLRALGGTFADALHARLRLLAIELEQERARLVDMLAWGALLLLLLSQFLTLASLLLVLVVWDTPYRLAVGGMLVAGIALAATCCAIVLARRWRAGHGPFASSLAALTADLQALR